MQSSADNEEEVDGFRPPTHMAQNTENSTPESTPRSRVRSWRLEAFGALVILGMLVLVSMSGHRQGTRAESALYRIVGVATTLPLGIPSEIVPPCGRVEISAVLTLRPRTFPQATRREPLLVVWLAVSAFESDVCRRKGVGSRFQKRPATFFFLAALSLSFSVCPDFVQLFPLSGR